MPMFVDTSPPGQCIFCRLVAGEIPSARVAEDDLALAFMDLGQVNPGHVLVASKRHAATLFDLTPEEAGAVMRMAQRVALAARTAFDPDGLMLLQANGAVAGQTVSGTRSAARRCISAASCTACTPWSMRSAFSTSSACQM